MTNPETLEDEARELAGATYYKYGRGEFSCDCGLPGAYIDGDAGPHDYARLTELIEHTRYAHVGRRSVLFTPAPLVVL